MTATRTVISTDSFIFKDNDTFLSQSNWQKFFKTAAQEGFTDHIGSFDGTKFVVKPYAGIVGGVRAEGLSMQNISAVTSAEVDCLIGVVFSGGNPQLVKYTGIKSNVNDSITLLSLFLLGLSISLDSFRFYLGYTVGIVDYILPIAYGIYGRGYWDLSQLLKKSGKPYSAPKTADSSASSVATPLCGYLHQNGLSQIYGNHSYNITIDSSYTLGEYHLYPVPACSMDPANIYIKNQTSGAVTIKLPLIYNMYFEYFTDNNWTENSYYLTYSLASGSELAITMLQVSQELYSSGGVDYPKSVYTVSQMVKSA